MLKVKHIEGKGFISVVTCDICEKSIENADLAAAVYPAPKTGGKDRFLGVLHVHKGACHKQAEEKLERAGYWTGWEELGRHLCSAFYSTGVNSEKLIEKLSFYGFEP